MNNDLMFSSVNPAWGTPRREYAKWNEEFGFTLDAAASHENAKCTWYYTKAGLFRRGLCLNDGASGLEGEWGWDGDEVIRGPRGRWTFCNPPYGNPWKACTESCTRKTCLKRGHIYEDIPGVADWVRKADAEMRAGNPSLLLLPARTDTTYFHAYIWDNDNHRTRPGVEMRLLPGRLRFEIDGVPGDAAPFPTLIAIFRGDAQ